MPNRLSTAMSPHVAQHARNPVDWYAWGPQAFAEAARRDVPVLISIGYSTCHWGHVMARESFGDPGIAAILNAGFVAVIVDREEHPDVDEAYLAAASAFTADIGWPLNVFVTPRGRPFFAGTYWPAEPVAGRLSFRQVLGAVGQAWETNREEVHAVADAVAGALNNGPDMRTEPGGALALPGVALEAVIAQLESEEDARFGGFGSGAKFPSTPVVEFLLDVAASDSHTSSATRRRALRLAQRTLVTAARSPLRDADGGFFRYATRPDWSGPHYERMLYDNAQLLSAFTTLAVLRVGSDVGREAARVARGIGEFMMRSLQLPHGGLASAQDCETALDGASDEGSYYQLSFVERRHHTPPRLDRKVLAGWNGLGIEALARAGHYLGRPDFLAGARRAAGYVLDHHVPGWTGLDDGLPDQPLIRMTMDGQASGAVATLADYGSLAAGLLTLGALGGRASDVRFLQAGRQLIGHVVGDASNLPAEPRGGLPGGPVLRPGGADPTLVELGMLVEQDSSEGSYPSGATAAGRAASLAYMLVGGEAYRTTAWTLCVPLVEYARRYPRGFGGTLRLALWLDEPAHQLVQIGAAERPAQSPDELGVRIAHAA